MLYNDRSLYLPQPLPEIQGRMFVQRLLTQISVIFGGFVLGAIVAGVSSYFMDKTIDLLLPSLFSGSMIPVPLFGAFFGGVDGAILCLRSGPMSVLFRSAVIGMLVTILVSGLEWLNDLLDKNK